MTLKEKIESFAKCFGSKPELFDDSDEMLAYCFDGLIIGKLKEGNYNFEEEDFDDLFVLGGEDEK
jgi:hypothetical protein